MPRGRKSKILEEIETRIDASAVLSAEEKEQARKRARDDVAEARKKKATEDLYLAFKKEEERAFDPTEEFEDFTVDLPPFAPMIKINNVGYFHGLTYEIPYSLARDMAYQQYCCWQHQNEIEGHARNGDLIRKPHLARMSAASGHVQGGHVNTAQGMRTVQ